MDDGNLFELVGKFPREIGIPNRFLDFSKRRFLDIVNKYNGYKKLFFLLYQCDSNQKYDNVIIDKIFFDFDGETAHNEAVKLHKWCLKKNLRHLLLFSGGGYHIFLFTKNGERLLNPKRTLWNVHYKISDELKLEMDKQVKGNITQSGRVPNTYNPRRRRYCIPISSEDLGKGHEFIKEKAKKQTFKFYYYGKKLFDINKHDIDNYEEKLDIPVLDIKIKKEINKDKVLKDLPLCVAAILKGGSPGYRERYLAISFFRDQGYLLSEVIEIFRGFLTEKKFRHSVFQERQPQRLYHRCELFFPNCKKIAKEGFCRKGCKWKNKIYL